MRGRPYFLTSYREQYALLETGTRRVLLAALLVFAVAVPLLFEDSLLLVLASGLAAAIGALGLNIVTGWAGQISLGHAFFVGLGAYTAAVLAGDPGGRELGLGLPMVVWLPAAALLPALVGAVIAPIAARVSGIYLAVVTLGLVFVGLHLFREASALTGGVGIGRPGPSPELAGVQLDADGPLLGVLHTSEQKLYLFALVLLVVFAYLTANLRRTRLGRSLQAVRDRDIAAATSGVPVTATKVWAFAISSAYAGVAGAVSAAVSGFIEPTSFDLFLSVQYVAMIFIGGIATVSGSISGAIFIIALHRIAQELSGLLPFVSYQPAPGTFSVFHVQALIYGALIVGFLMFEPRGFHGLWIRAQRYWRTFPFGY